MNDYRASLKAQGKVLMFKNERVDDMSHEALLDAYYRICEMLEDERRYARSNDEMERLFTATRIAMGGRG